MGKLIKNQTTKHDEHEMFMQQITYRNATHIGLYCAECTRKRSINKHQWIQWVAASDYQFIKAMGVPVRQPLIK